MSFLALAPLLALAASAEPAVSTCRLADELIEAFGIATAATFERESEKAIASGQFAPTLYWWVRDAAGDAPEYDGSADDKNFGFIELKGATGRDASVRARAALAGLRPAPTTYVLVWADVVSVASKPGHDDDRRVLMLELGDRSAAYGYRTAVDTQQKVGYELGCAESLFNSPAR